MGEKQHHYYDNGTRNYRLSSDDDLEQFPGMDHLYIRLSWAHFEPNEGNYNWSWIDDVKDHWTAKGYGISLRISTCETGEAQATPAWVVAAGAKGGVYKAYKPAPSGGIRAYDDLRGAIKLTHATYLGYHGDARRWLSDHPVLAKELANRLGYWYFPKSLSMPQSLVAGRENAIKIDWQNQGTAPAYQPFALRAKLTGNAGTLTLPLGESNNLAWMPGSECNERYSVRLPKDTLAGRYAFSIALLDNTVSPDRIIEIGLKEPLRAPDGYYRLAEVEVQSP